MSLMDMRSEALDRLWELTEYRRPSGSKAARRFGRRFLAPIMGDADKDGNYFCRVGNGGRVLFAAHYDTVHKIGGMQLLDYDFETDVMRLAPKSDSNCLGADCTTGLWLILEMIAVGVPGHYAVFADEEIGCVGSRAFAARRIGDLAGVDVVLSLDRKGTESIITHQMGRRTASGKFARSLSAILGMGHVPDDGGSYTDSNEFASLIPECSNLSVGYYGQHGRGETQDCAYAWNLRCALIEADWSQLVVARDPSVREFASIADKYRFPTDFDYWHDDDELESLVREYPRVVADLLRQYGVDAETLKLGIGL